MNDEYEFEASEYEADAQEDNDDMEGFWADHGMQATATLRLFYESSSKEHSERIVDVRLFADSAWGPQLIGHCRTHNATRTFKIDNIRNCVDETTGLPVDDVYNYLFDLYEKTPEYSFNQATYRHIDILRAAIHLGTCAGLTAVETATILRQVMHQLSGDFRIGPEPIAQLLSQYLDSNVTGVDQTFRLIAGRLNKSLSPNNKETVIRLCTKIAGIKGPINPASQESIDYLTKRFAKPE